MKTLYVVRHAKSSWNDPTLSDHDRPLNETGIRKTKIIVEYLKQKSVAPDLFKSSSALRALSTAKIIANALNYPVEDIEIEENLYHASAETVFSELFVLPNSVNSVMIFGHNPTFTYFVNGFLNPKMDNLPTSGVVSISFETDEWEKIAMVDYKVNFVVTPKLLK
jgi:phosphohistidine phosphatase